MKIKKVVKLFKQGNVCVVGLRGKGKDMLMGNVIARRKKEDYVCNTDYCCKAQFYPFELEKLECGKNIYENFINGNITPYTYPYRLGTDVYIADAGIYFPSHYCNELNKKYGYVPTFMALSRHLGDCNVHFNVQNLNRVWDKIREQSDTYIMCRRCIVLFGRIVIQQIRIYEKYQSCVDRVPPFRMKRPLFNREAKAQIDIARSKYDCTYGVVKSGTLLYWNKTNYDTHIFREILKNGNKKENEEN